MALIIVLYEIKYLQFRNGLHFEGQKGQYGQGKRRGRAEEARARRRCRAGPSARVEQDSPQGYWFDKLNDLFKKVIDLIC